MQGEKEPTAESSAEDPAEPPPLEPPPGPPSAGPDDAEEEAERAVLPPQEVEHDHLPGELRPVSEGLRSEAEQQWAPELEPGVAEESEEQLLSEDEEAPGYQPGDPEDIKGLLAGVGLIGRPETSSTRRRQAMEQLCMALRPQGLRAKSRRIFIQRAASWGLAEMAVALIESGGAELTLPACNLLVDFTFGSDMGARAVLQVFDRIAARFKKQVFETLDWDDLPLLESAVRLCTNIAASGTSGHQLLIPLVQPICLRIIKSPRASEELRGNTITLLANLSLTVATELRSLRVADVLLGLVLDGGMAEAARSVAESVIIFLHGEGQSEEVDKLISADVVGSYCVPLMEATLIGDVFRGMYPYLMYSARVFQVLARSRVYAEALAADPRVAPLLIEATRCHEGPVRTESDLEGRRMALEALSSLAAFRLWPEAAAPADHNAASAAFLADRLPRLLADKHVGTRSAAVKLWAHFNSPVVHLVQALGHHMEERLDLPRACWRLHVLPFLFPFLTQG